MIIIIKDNKTQSIDLLHGTPDKAAHIYVEAWQRERAAWTLGGGLPSITWKVAESNNLIDAMIESTRI